MRRPPAIALVLLAVMSVASGFLDLRIRQYPERPYKEFIPRVVDGTADAPERYRVLVPFTVDGISRATGIPISTVWHISRLLLFFAAYVTFYAYLSIWYGPTPSLLGTALVAATLPLTFTNSWAHPDHIAELCLFTAGCAAIAMNRVLAVAVILGIAALNRETAVFLVPLYFLAGQPLRGRIPVTVLLALEWAVIYVGLRAWRGFVHYDYGQFTRNLQYLKLLPAPVRPLRSRLRLLRSRVVRRLVGGGHEPFGRATALHDQGTVDRSDVRGSSVRHFEHHRGPDFCATLCTRDAFCNLWLATCR